MKREALYEENCQLRKNWKKWKREPLPKKATIFFAKEID